jgi:RNA polymerase sigma factor (sigma-70 family)
VALMVESPAMSSVDRHDQRAAASIETVFRMEFPTVVARLANAFGDLALAEDLAQDALVAALTQWPAEGVPRNPAGWLTTVARRRAVDRFRRERTLATKYALVAAATDDVVDEVDVPDRDAIADDQLRLIFVACHTVLPVPARVALTLRLVAGLTTGEIARAYQQPEATVAQRISRAKRTIADAGVPFEVPTGADRVARLGSVLEVVYAIFNEGYTATAGGDWTRPDLCFEALRLARLLSHLAPDDAESHGLLALIELQSSRLSARIDADGRPVLLADQDRRRWDALHIRRGLAALERARALDAHMGVYTLQAAIAACHTRAASVADTDWTAISELYATLASLTRSPVVELNRAVAVSMAVGPDPALGIVDELVGAGALDRYHLLHSVRGDLLARLGRVDEAAAEFQRAAALTSNAAERQLSMERAAALSDQSMP